MKHRIITLASSLLAAALPLSALGQDAAASRHALIIGIGQYSNAAISSLAGVQHDMDSARRMAQSMGIPPQNMHFVRDAAATVDEMTAQIKALDQRLQPGDRVFVYYSGHGTRWHEPDAPEGVCTEGLVATDGQVLSNKMISQLLAPVAAKADKMMVFYDACFSGGVAGKPFLTRSLKLGAANLTPKVVSKGSADACFQPSNFRTRSLSTALQQQGSVPQNVVHIAASRPDEVSFDNSKEGGLATTAWRDCLLGEAQDLDGSGAITVDEITRCAQTRLDSNLANVSGVLGQHMTLGGNQQFVPAWIKAAFTAPATPTPVAAKPLAPGALLGEIHAQRDGRRQLTVVPDKNALSIGKDALQLHITPDRDGYLYLAMAGSDGESLYLLYPNQLDGDNRVQAGKTIDLPRASWRITAGGPAGDNTLLVLLSDTPRDTAALKGDSAGPFMHTLLDGEGRSLLQQTLGRGKCVPDSARRNLQVGRGCSDSFAAALLTIREQP